MSIKNTLKVTEIQRFCMHDGPGVRTTVFLKGCPLRCAWCHNPETQSASREMLFYREKCILCRSCSEVCKANAHTFENGHIILRDRCASCFECANICPTGALDVCGREMTPDKILATVERDSAFYGTHGGITLSGGEPLCQPFAVELLKACKERGISTAVETCGYVDTDVLLSSIPYVDIFLWDIKDTDSDRHQKYTGVSNERIISNLKEADRRGAKTRLRCIIISGVNTDKAHYEGLALLVKSLSNCEGIELIPYHAYGGSKATLLGGEDNGRREWIPSKDELDFARKFIFDCGGRVI